MDVHIRLEDLRAFARGELPTGEVRNVVAHLLSGCAACKAKASAAFGGRLYASPGAVERARALVADAGPSAGAGGSRVREVEAALARAWDLRHENPEKMIQEAEAALRIARGLSGEEIGEDRAADWQCRAYALLGNACRIAERWEEAAEALGRAERLRGRGTGDERLRAWVTELRASLYGDRGDLERAIALATEVCELRSRLGDRHLAGRALISRGTFVGRAGRIDEAIALLEDGLRRIDDARDPALRFIAFHNRLSLLVDADRLGEALAVLAAHRRIWPEGSLHRIKLQWIEGRIELARGNLARAEWLLLSTRDEFVRRALPYKAAIVSLDLAVVALKRLRSDLARPLIAGALRVFAALRLPREAMGAVLLLERAIEKDALCAALLERVGERLRKVSGRQRDSSSSNPVARA